MTGSSSLDVQMRLQIKEAVVQHCSTGTYVFAVYAVFECMNLYVTVSVKRGHSVQNVHLSYKRLQVQRSTRVNFRQVYLGILSFLPAHEQEWYVLYAGRHALSKTRRKYVAARPWRRLCTNQLTVHVVFEQLQHPVSIQEPA